MKKICLLRPPKPIQNDSFSSGVSIPPIGLAYLTAFAEKNGIDVQVIDGVGEDIENYYHLNTLPNTTIQGMFLDQLCERIEKDVLFIGISCMFSCEWPLYEQLINLIKKRHPNIPIVLGGEHATAEAENILKVCPAVDICVRGEGEETLIDLYHFFSSGSPHLSNIPGINYRSGLDFVKNKKRERIIYLDTLPLPNWEKIPVKNYHRLGYGMASMNRSAMPILASRGCPYQCTFCSSPQMWGTDLYLRSPKSIVEEIKSYVDKYQIEHIDFVDIVGVLNKNWIVELLNLMIQEKLPITWLHSAGTRSEILDEEVLMLLKKSNVLRIFYAPESGSKETLKRIKKRISLSRLLRSMKRAKELDISMRAPLIYGFPDQTLKEAFQNLIFSFKLSILGVDDVVAHVFSAYPGSELFHLLNQRGEIDVDRLIKTNQYNQFLQNEFTTKINNLHSWSKGIPSWSLPFFQIGGMAFSYFLLFLFHPSKFFKTIDRIFFKKKPLTLLDHVIYSYFFNKKIIVKNQLNLN